MSTTPLDPTDPADLQAMREAHEPMTLDAILSGGIPNGEPAILAARRIGNSRTFALGAAHKLAAIQRTPGDPEARVRFATLDHVIPLSRGGLDNDNNLVAACRPCNDARGDTMPELTRDLRDMTAVEIASMELPAPLRVYDGKGNHVDAAITSVTPDFSGDPTYTPCDEDFVNISMQVTLEPKPTEK